MAIPVLERVPRRSRRAARSRMVFPLTVVVLGAVAAAGTYLVRQHAYRGEALPGVEVLGIDVSGRSPAGIADAATAAASARLARPVTVNAAGRSLTVRPGDVLRLDASATAGAALAAGRESVRSRARTLLLPVPPTREVAPVFRPRPVAAGRLFARLDAFGRAAVPARIWLAGLEPVATPGRAGSRVDQRAFLAALSAAVLNGDRSVAAVYRRAAPPIPDAAVVEAARTARVVLSAPISLRFEGRELGTLGPDELAGLLRFRPSGARYTVALADGPLAARVRPLLEPWRRAPVSARFDVSGSLVRVVPSQPGRDMDPGLVAGAVTAAAYSRTDRTADLALRVVQPALTTRQANALGIRRQLVSFTTDMGPSSSNRIHNVHLMAAYIDGTIIRPGATFSFNDVVGPRTPERGFLEGQMIVGSLLLPAIGGGVCQTATTLFNDAFQAGLPVLARTNHNFYISHYPLGRDATVSWGGPDFVFRNDLKHAILIESSYTDSTLTFTFYGMPQGRRAVATTGLETNFRAATMTYALDPSAPPGSVQVVPGSDEQGFDVTVNRTVYERGRVLRRDSFKSHYIPAGPTTVYGPGTNPPRPYIVLPPHP